MSKLEKIYHEINVRLDGLIEMDEECRRNAEINHRYNDVRYFQNGKFFTKRAKDVVNEVIEKHAKDNDGWIPVEDRLPEESGTYRVTVFDGIRERVSYLKWQKRFKRWNLRGATAYWKIIAWQENPEPYRRDEK